MSIGQPGLLTERLQIGLVHGRKMFDADRDRRPEGRIAGVVSLAQFRARRRKAEAIVVRHVLGAVEADFATVVVEFRKSARARSRRRRR